MGDVEVTLLFYREVGQWFNGNINVKCSDSNDVVPFYLR